MMQRIASFLFGVVRVALALVPVSLAAQQAARPSWTVAAPDAALAWFTVLAEWRVDGDGAFSYFDARGAGDTPASTEAATRQRLRSDPARGVLHFVPLYYPSADRRALVSALRASATSASSAAAAAVGEPRATFLQSALARTLAASARRDYLPPLASALERASPALPPAARLAFWQQRLDSIYRPALAPHLARERLDGGVLIIAPALGAEGRLFSATPERSDNLVAVGAFSDDPDPEAPLLAFVREVCFPAVSRAASAAGIGPSSANASRRASLAAVRCGATLAQTCLPTRVAAYKAFWLRRAEAAGLVTERVGSGASAAVQAAAFDRVFPRDNALDVRVGCPIR